MNKNYTRVVTIFMNMIFQFEHLGLWDKDTRGPVDVVKLKKILRKLTFLRKKYMLSVIHKDTHNILN